MKIVITGGAGYLGCAMASFLSGRLPDAEICIYDNFYAGNWSILTQSTALPNVKIVEADILDSYTLASVLKGADWVLHMATYKSDNPKEYHRMEQINHWGTSELCNACIHAKVKNLLFFSDLECLFADAEVLDESSPSQSPSGYGQSMTRAEAQVQRLGQQVSHHILRLGDLWGYSSGLTKKGLVNTWMMDALLKNRIQIWGNGRNEVTLTHIDHLCKEVLHMIQSGDKKASLVHVYDVIAQTQDLLELFQEIFTGLEFIFVNAHIEYPSLKASSKYARVDTFDAQRATMMAQLKSFATHLSIAARK